MFGVNYQLQLTFETTIMMQVLNKTESKNVLKSNCIGNLAYIYRGRPLVVPMTYFYNETAEVIVCYTSEGQKIRAMRENKNVSLGVTETHSINSWNSVLVQGTFKELFGSMAKSQLHLFSLGVKDLIIQNEHRKLDFIHEFSSKIQNEKAPVVFHIEVEELTGRKRRK